MMQAIGPSEQRRKLVASARIAAAHLPPGLPPLWFLTDPQRTPDPCAVAAALPAGWGVIFRHFGAADRTEQAQRLAAIARRNRLHLLIAADPTLALAVGAGGVHWPFARRAEARQWRKRFRVMTISAHTPAELRAAMRAGADGVLLSAVFPSASPTAGKPYGHIRFRALARSASAPVYALGGVDADNSAKIADIAGVAAIDGVRLAFRT
jgi:thiamine-phosphate pyrophosphorylase